MARRHVPALQRAEVPIDCDVAVIGAGPAGRAAASVCARTGLATVVLDDAPSPGGQMHRAITSTPLRDRAVLGPDYWQGERLVEEFRASGAAYEPSTTVWNITADLQVAASKGGITKLVNARSVILATGAIERPFPIPGWTLVGVTGLGAAQSLLKTSGAVPAGRTIIAGTGPLLWLAARQMLEAGAKVTAILETTAHDNRATALRHLPGFLVSPYFVRAMKLLVSVRGRVPVVPHVADLRASGVGRVESVAYRTEDGNGRTLPVDSLLLHQGVVPETHLAMAAGVAHRWDPMQLCWTPIVDANGGTNVPGLLIAGDAGGIGGAQSAAWRGVLAGIAVAEAMQPGKKIPHAKLARTAIAQFARGRRFMDTLYQPALHFRAPADEAIACPCEEVTAGEIRAAVDEGCVGPNQVKAFTRCGMGPCQGRRCSLTVSEIIAQQRGVPVEQVGHFTARFPAHPVTVAEIASLPQSPAAVDAVVR